jgi:hypothetical protein
MFGKTVSHGWFSATEAEIHRRSIYHDLACLCPEDEHKVGGCLGDLEILPLSDDEVEAWDQCHAEKLGSPIDTWRCPACGKFIQEDEPHHGAYCNLECDQNHQSDLDAQAEDER